MQFLVRTLLILTTVIAASDTGFAEKDQSKAAAPKAVTPEVQTAAWAVKWWQPRHDQKLADLKKMEKV
ncbi:MAG: hypothetical protein ACI8P0_002076, partial [Planctomycetaceae bacterium]